MESSLTCSDLQQPLSAPSPLMSAVRVVIPDSSFSLELPIVSPNESSAAPTDNSIVGCKSSEKIGRWTEHEHSVFLEGLEKHGKQWKTIAGMIGTRTVVQVRTHAQKYFQKMERKQIASISSSSSIDSTRPLDKVTFTKRKSLSDISSLTPKKKKKTQRLSLPVGGLSIQDFQPNLQASCEATGIVSDQLWCASSGMSKSSRCSSGNWSTVSPNTVIGELLDLSSKSSDHVGFHDHEQSDDPATSFDFQDMNEDPLEWLVDLDTQRYLPESSLPPAFPELADAVVENTTSASIIDDAVLNNMVDPAVTMQSLFPHSELVFDY